MRNFDLSVYASNNISIIKIINSLQNKKCLIPYIIFAIFCQET